MDNPVYDINEVSRDIVSVIRSTIKHEKTIPKKSFLKNWYWKCIVTDIRFEGDVLLIEVMRPNKFIGKHNLLYEVRSAIKQKYPKITKVELKKSSIPAIIELFG